MAISDAQFTAWLSENTAVRCILVEIVANISGGETTHYLSSKNYTDNVAGRIYNPIVVGNSVTIVEKLSLTDTGKGSLNFGDIEISNIDGSLDGWLGYIWANRACNVFIGDVRWARSDFRTIFAGITEDIDSKNSHVLNFKVRDKLQRLNYPVTEVTLGGTTKNKDELIPLTFGEAHNVTPLLVDPATLKYQVHDGPIEGIVEVRDEGYPVDMIEFPAADGTFKLAASPYGKITCTPQGDKEGGSTWHLTVAKIVQRIVTNYGEPNNKFTTGDLDTSQLATFDAANQQPVGVYLSKRENVLNVCAKLASSVGAQLVMSRNGLLRLIKVELPAPGTPVAITESDIVANTLKISKKLNVESAQKVAFNKNWTVQEKLDTGIPVFHKQMYAQEWLAVTVEDATVKTNYKQTAEPIQKETMLIRETEASPEATRLLNLYKIPRFVYSFKGIPRLMELELGDPVTLTHSRFGLSGGKSGQVVSLSINWQSLLVDVEVLA